MAYDGTTDCAGAACLTPLVIADFTCADGTINQAFFDKLNGQIQLLAESSCSTQDVVFPQVTILSELLTETGTFETTNFTADYEVDVSSLDIGSCHNEVEIIVLLNADYELITTTCTFGVRDTNAGITYLSSLEVASNSGGPDSKRDSQRTYARIVADKINISLVTSNPGTTTITAIFRIKH